MSLHHFKHTIQTHRGLMHLLIFLKWLLLSGLAGLVAGFIACLFSISLGFVTTCFQTYPWLVFGLPVGGLAIVALYHLAGIQKSRGTNLVFSAIHRQEKIPLVMAPLIFLSTVITHLFGGSAGREGAALQLGGSIAQNLGSALHLKPKDLNILVMCGMSAAFAALFGTPVTAAIFAMEVVSVGIMHYSALVPTAIASFTAVEIAQWMGLEAEHFQVGPLPPTTLDMVARVALLALLLAWLSILFCNIMHEVSHFLEKHFPNPYGRVVAGSLVLIVLTLIFGTDYNGAGMPVITRAIEQSTTRPEAFLLKILFTSITLGCGFKGGEIVPSFYIGACFGCLVAPYLGIPAQFGAVIGLMILFCGVTNCPMTSMFLVIELFGYHELILILVANAIGYMLSGYHGLYSEQKIMYSKFSTTFIDNPTNQAPEVEQTTNFLDN